MINSKHPRYSSTALAVAFTMLPLFAHAHPGHGETGLAAGMSHPLQGWDHILAMIAVGLWAAQLGGRAVWLVPASFASLMALGGALGMAGAGLPFVEQGIPLSVLILGLLIATAAKVPLKASMILVGLFALCHGYAHGAEAPATAAGFAYGAGFVVSTICLHALGIGAGVLSARLSAQQWVRWAGAAICLGGVGLWLN